uniref:Aldehyde dehydrogenase domain-containing protein n=2 Tax=Pectinophora gossypiella TaxID=13191 RepID=A0A1E1W8H7_PECGO
MEDLKFDKMNIDTKLAEVFLEQNTSEIDIVKSGDNDKITAQMKSYFNKEIKNLPTDKKLQLFASKMEDNSELFAQLEALLRGVPKQEVIDIDKKLIVQNFKYWSFNNPINSSFLGLRPTNIEISESSPLAKLGSVVCGIKFNINVKVHCCDVTAPVCYLFVRLCMESGIDRVNLFHKKEEMTESGEDFRNGCSAVVTEHSDIDSAIDVFLYSTSKRPWKLNHLFVQESEIERLKINLIAKSQLKGDSIENTNLASKNKIEIVAYENKLFAFDFIADADRPEGKQVVIVEAYRTVKELLTLIKKENPFFLSLWTNDISEANEIAYNVILPIVWINDYGIFGGPDRSSQAFYSAYFKLCYCIDKDLLTNNVVKSLQNWSTMNTTERVIKMLKVVEVLKAENSPDVESAALIEDAITNLESNKFVDIENGKLWVSFEDFQGCIVFLENDSNLKKVVTSLMYGVGCIRKLEGLESTPNKKSRIIKLFQEENIPYMETDKIFKQIIYGVIYSNSNDSPAHPTGRMIYTSFGAIFAK